MKIAVLGAGNVGGTLARVWSAAGHEVVLGVRDPAAARVRALLEASGGRLRAASLAEAARGAELVLLATPWEAVPAALAAAGDLTGKVLIDATNPLAPDLSGLCVGHDDSAGETVARLAPGARVVKAFNTIGAAHMDHALFDGQRASMFVAGDDAPARRAAMRLAVDAGFEPVDVGPLRQARLLEPLAMLWISMAYAHGHGPGIAFRLLRA